jgi:hypothetical protein
MAGDWIKMRKELPTDPAVIRMAGLLKLDTFGVVGRLHSLWAWADSHCDSHGRVTLVTRDTLDSVTDCEGFGAAMESVGWIECHTDCHGGVTFPRFERHMGTGAKERSAAAQRKARQREKERNEKRTASVTENRDTSRNSHAHVTPVTGDSHGTSVTREEKRREEKEEEVPIGTSCPVPVKAPASVPMARDPPVMIFPCVGSKGQEWPLSREKLAEWQNTHPGIDCLTEAKFARQWLLDNPSRRKTFQGMTKFLGGWFGRAQDRAGAKPAGGYKTATEKQNEYAAATLLDAMGITDERKPDRDQDRGRVVTVRPDAGTGAGVHG